MRTVFPLCIPQLKLTFKFTISLPPHLVFRGENLTIYGFTILSLALTNKNYKKHKPIPAKKLNKFFSLPFYLWPWLEGPSESNPGKRHTIQAGNINFQGHRAGGFSSYLRIYSSVGVPSSPSDIREIWCPPHCASANMHRGATTSIFHRMEDVNRKIPTIFPSWDVTDICLLYTSPSPRD